MLSVAAVLMRAGRGVMVGAASVRLWFSLQLSLPRLDTLTKQTHLPGTSSSGSLSSPFLASFAVLKDDIADDEEEQEKDRDLTDDDAGRERVGRPDVLSRCRRCHGRSGSASRTAASGVATTCACGDAASAVFRCEKGLLTLLLRQKGEGYEPPSSERWQLETRKHGGSGPVQLTVISLALPSFSEPSFRNISSIAWEGSIFICLRLPRLVNASDTPSAHLADPGDACAVRSSSRLV